MARFGIYAAPSRTILLDVQSDPLDPVSARVIVPLNLRDDLREHRDWQAVVRFRKRLGDNDFPPRDRYRRGAWANRRRTPDE